MADITTQPRYTVVIQWCEEDKHYVVSLPEWGPYCKTHGDTYEEAAKNAREVLELLLEDEFGKPVNPPAPHLFRYPGADVVDLPDQPNESSQLNVAELPTKQSA